MFQFLACKEESLNILFSRQVGLNMSLHQTSGFDSTERKASKRYTTEIYITVWKITVYSIASLNRGSLLEMSISSGVTSFEYALL